MTTPDDPSTDDAAAVSDTSGRSLLIAACVSSAALLGLTFSAGPLVLDECGTYWVVDSEVPATVWQRSLDYSAVPPLSSWIDQGCLNLVVKREWAFRLPSLLFAFAAVLMVYQVGTDLKDPFTGGIAALLLAWHPESLDEVRIARCYGLVLLLSSVVLWATERWWKAEFSWKRAVIWALACVALIWAHYTSALLVVICGFVALACSASTKGKGRKPVATVLITLAVVGGLCTPLISPLLRLMEWGPALNYSPQQSSIWNLRNVIGPIWWAGLPASLVAAWLFRNRNAMASAVDRRVLLLVTVCACLPLLIFALFSFSSMSSLANPRYRLAYVPAGACLLATILTSFRGRAAPVAGALVAVVIAWALSPALPWELVRLSNHKDVEWHELNLYIEQHGFDGEPILVQSGLTEGHLVPAFADDLLFMEYVACRVTRFYVDSPHPRYALPFVWSEPTGMVDHFREMLRVWREAPGGFWVAAATDTDLNLGSLHEIQQIAARTGYEVIDTKEWPSAVLLRFSHPNAAVPSTPYLPMQ